MKYEHPTSESWFESWLFWVCPRFMLPRGSRCWFRLVRLCPATGKHRLRFQVLVWAWFTPGCPEHLGNESADWNYSVCVSLSLLHKMKLFCKSPRLGCWQGWFFLRGGGVCAQASFLASSVLLQSLLSVSVKHTSPFDKASVILRGGYVGYLQIFNSIIKIPLKSIGSWNLNIFLEAMI